MLVGSLRGVFSPLRRLAGARPALFPNLIAPELLSPARSIAEVLGCGEARAGTAARSLAETTKQRSRRNALPVPYLQL